MTYINPNPGHKAAVMLTAHFRAIPTLKRQCGMATLAISLVLLIAVTIMTFTVARVSGLEQRISANDVRTLTAHEAAQAGIEQGIAYLNANLPKIDSDCPAPQDPPDPNCLAIPTSQAGWRNNAATPRWTFCTTLETALPCGDGQTNRYGNTWLKYTAPNQISLPGSPSPYTTAVYYLTESVSGAVEDVKPQPRIIVLASATPNSDPLAGSAVIQQIVQYFFFVNINMPSSPLAALGKVELKGNIGVYGNPTPAASFYPPLGAGKPLSVWSGGALGVTGSAQTCVPGSDCTGTTNGIPNKLTDKNNYPPGGGDIVQNASLYPINDPRRFPTDLFKHIFGVPSSEASTIKDKSTVLADCTGLTGASSGLFWVTGNCDIGKPIGSAEAPAIIVVEGNFTMNSNDNFYGLIYMKGTGGVSLVGGPTLWGGIVSDHDIDIGAGNYTVRYRDLSNIIHQGNNTGGFAKVPGGWLDAYQRPVS